MIINKFHANVESNACTLSAICKKYKEFFFYHSLNQLICSPIWINSSTSTLLDHVITHTPHKISQSGVLDIGLSDHQLIFCTRKMHKEKSKGLNKVKLRCFKNYDIQVFENKLMTADFLDYSEFNDVNLAYSDFIKIC